MGLRREVREPTIGVLHDDELVCGRQVFSHRDCRKHSEAAKEIGCDAAAGVPDDDGFVGHESELVVGVGAMVRTAQDQGWLRDFRDFGLYARTPGEETMTNRGSILRRSEGHRDRGAEGLSRQRHSV